MRGSRRDFTLQRDEPKKATALLNGERRQPFTSSQKLTEVGRRGDASFVLFPSARTSRAPRFTRRSMRHDNYVTSTSSIRRATASRHEHREVRREVARVARRVVNSACAYIERVNILCPVARAILRNGRRNTTTTRTHRDGFVPVEEGKRGRAATCQPR